MGFVLGKLLSAFLLPPGVFVVALFVMGFAARKAGRVVQTVLWAIAALLFVLSIAPGRAALTAPLEAAYPALTASSATTPDAIAVLGGGAVAPSPEAPGAESLTPVSLKRVVYAYDLYRRLGVPLIVSGGDPFDQTQATEADLMKTRLIAFGVPDAAIVVDAESNSTLDSGRFVAQIAKARGLERIAVVTSAIHMPRAVRVFRRFGVRVTAAPTDFSGAPRTLNYQSFLPSADSLAGTWAAMHEYLGMVYYYVAYGV